jgi:DNA-binding GntR family transcriptional regulator
MSKLPSADRPRLADEICDFLRDQIYAGRFSPGTQLRQEQLAEELQVSRTPLREALRVLQSEGLLLERRGNRVEVISADKDRFLDALLLRELVDGAAARLCAEKDLPPRKRAAFDRAIAAQQGALKPWDRTAFARGDADLHAAILQLSGNFYLDQQIKIVRLTIQVFQMSTNFGPDEAAAKIKEHRAIVKAIVSGDGDKAEELSRSHIHRVIGELRSAPVSA